MGNNQTSQYKLLNKLFLGQFQVFFNPSETYYKAQSFWIILQQLVSAYIKIFSGTIRLKRFTMISPLTYFFCVCFKNLQIEFSQEILWSKGGRGLNQTEQAPLITNPPPTCSTTLSKKRKKKEEENNFLPGLLKKCILPLFIASELLILFLLLLLSRSVLGIVRLTGLWLERGEGTEETTKGNYLDCFDR